MVQWHTIRHPEAAPDAFGYLVHRQSSRTQSLWETRMRNAVALIVLAGAILFAPAAPAAEDLLLSSRLNFTSNRPDGPLITGSGMDGGVVTGKPNYVIIYAERSFNCKRQARRTVSLYEKYRGRVNFVVIDLDRHRSPAQREVVQKYFKKYLPQVVVTDPQGSSVYDKAGEVEERTISGLFDAALK